MQNNNSREGRKEGGKMNPTLENKKRKEGKEKNEA